MPASLHYCCCIWRARNAVAMKSKWLHFRWIRACNVRVRVIRQGRVHAVPVWGSAPRCSPIGDVQYNRSSARKLIDFGIYFQVPFTPLRDATRCRSLDTATVCRRCVLRTNAFESPSFIQTPPSLFSSFCRRSDPWPPSSPTKGVAFYSLLWICGNKYPRRNVLFVSPNHSYVVPFFIRC